jgi:hypothetical protein
MSRQIAPVTTPAAERGTRILRLVPSLFGVFNENSLPLQSLRRLWRRIRIEGDKPGFANRMPGLQ